MDLTTPIDSYCERTSTAFWAEPLNAFSNGAFLIAALYGAIVLRRTWQEVARPRRARAEGGETGAPDGPAPGVDGAALLLVALTALVGTGSFLFHTVANGWTLLADVVPIALFVFAYFALAMTRFFGLSLTMTAGATLLFVVLAAGLIPLLRPLFGGSSAYVPALLALGATGAILLASGRREGRLVFVAACVFFASLMARMADPVLCAALPMGTHFLWHLLNAGVLALLLKAAILAGPGERVGAG